MPEVKLEHIEQAVKKSFVFTDKQRWVANPKIEGAQLIALTCFIGLALENGFSKNDIYDYLEITTPVMNGRWGESCRLSVEKYNKLIKRYIDRVHLQCNSYMGDPLNKLVYKVEYIRTQISTPYQISK